MSTSSSTSILSVGTNSQGLPTLGNTVSGGIDVNSAVNTALAAAEIPMQLLQQQQSKLQSQDSSLSQVSTDLSSLLTSVQALGDPWGALNSMTTTSSDTSVVTASAAAGSQAGNHTVVVGNLATKSSYYSSELASGSTTFTAGTITLKVGSGSAVTIPASGTANTLTSLAQDINNANAGITATVVTDAGGNRRGDTGIRVIDVLRKAGQRVGRAAGGNCHRRSRSDLERDRAGRKGRGAAGEFA